MELKGSKKLYDYYLQKAKKESIQWNWKLDQNEEQNRVGHEGIQNPFNGIER